MAADASGLRRKVARYAEQVAQRAASEVDREVVAWARSHRDSGEMLRSHFGPRRVGPASFRLGFAADHSSFPDTGTRPHVIRPRRAKVLRFVVGGRVVYARKVNHPGTSGDRGWSDATSQRAWARAVNQAARRTTA